MFITVLIYVIIVTLYLLSYLELYRRLRSAGVNPLFAHPALWIPLSFILGLWAIPFSVKVLKISPSAPSETLLILTGFLVFLTLGMFGVGLILFIVLEIVIFLKREELKAVMEEYPELRKPLAYGKIMWFLLLVLFFALFLPLYLMRRSAELDMIRSAYKLIQRAS